MAAFSKISGIALLVYFAALTEGSRNVLVHINRKDGIFASTSTSASTSDSGSACNAVASERVMHTSTTVTENNHHMRRLLSGGKGRAHPPKVRVEPVSLSRRGCTLIVNIDETDFEEEDTNAVIEAIGHMHEVDAVEEDMPVYASSVPWGLRRIIGDNLSEKAPFSPVFTGDAKGLGAVYVVDTGIRTDHIEFTKDRATWGVDVTAGVDNTDEPSLPFDRDPHGHGTHCAGTVAGMTVGVSRDAQVVAVRVLGPGGSGSNSGIIRALRWIEKYHASSFPKQRWPAVVSMSLGGPRSSVLNAAVLDMVDEESGHIVVMAAGNENTDACLVSPASASADSKYAISVASSTADDSRSSFSNYGTKCVDIFAPGSSVLSAGIKSNTHYTTMSGTSMAAPHVAGALMHFLQKHAGDRDAAVSDLLSTMLPPSRIKASRSPNAGLLQIPTYTGPPTPPTVAPTMPPTIPAAAFCGGPNRWCVPDSSIAFGHFGPDLEFDTKEAIVARVGHISVAYTGKNQLLCDADEINPPKLDWLIEGGDGRLILIVPRGGCLFYDKVVNAQRVFGNKLAAVLIEQFPKEAIFRPNYYGTGNVRVPCLMIDNPMTAAIKRNMSPVGARILGRDAAHQPEPPSTRPTGRPTTSVPTPAPTAERSCIVAPTRVRKINYGTARRACGREHTLCTAKNITAPTCGGFNGVEEQARQVGLNNVWGFWIDDVEDQHDGDDDDDDDDNDDEDNNDEDGGKEETPKAKNNGRPYWSLKKHRENADGKQEQQQQQLEIERHKGKMKRTGILCC